MAVTLISIRLPEVPIFHSKKSCQTHPPREITHIPPERSLKQSLIEMNIMGVTFQGVWTDERQNSNACNCFLYGKTQRKREKREMY